MNSGELYVVKRNSEVEPVSFDKVLKRIHILCKHPVLHHLQIDGTVVAQKVCSQIFPGVKTTQLDELAAQICSSMSTIHPDFGTLASRISISNHQKNTQDSFTDVVKVLYNNYNHFDFHCPLVSQELYELAQQYEELINSRINHNRDYLLDYFGFKTLEKSYLMKCNGQIVERPQHLWMRVAIGLYGKNITQALECYDELSQKLYTHATPTLFNSGTPSSQLASCFLMAMKDDSIDGIYETIKNCALISKYAGGIGVHIHNVRASGSWIRGTNGTSNGIVPMLRVFNDTARYVDQGGGKRNGSIAMYLEPWHMDIFEFLQLKKNHGDEQSRARDLFYGMWIPDLFMRRVEENGEWTLMCPNMCPGLADTYGEEFERLYTHYEAEGKGTKKIQAQQLWFSILESQIETGTPYLLYKDSCNFKSNQKNLGTIKSSNLCTEILEYSDSKETAVCNLASINLSIVVKQELPEETLVIYSKSGCSYCKLAKGWMNRNGIRYKEIHHTTQEEIDAWKKKYGFKTYPQIFEGENEEEYVGGYNDLIEKYRPQVDYAKLATITRSLVRNLNQTIDRNFYPIPETRRSNFRHRPIGIGVQGLADLFFIMKMPFDSPQAKHINREIFACIYYNAMLESCNLSKERNLVIRSHLVELNEKGLSTSDPENWTYEKTFEKGFIAQWEFEGEHILSSEYKGSYCTFEGSPLSQGQMQFDLWGKQPSSSYNWNQLKQMVREHGVRNSLLVAPMPTASTSQILGNYECFEPITQNIYVRRTLAGEFVVVNKYLMNDLIDLGIWNQDLKDVVLSFGGSVAKIESIPADIRNIYKTIWEIKQKDLIDMAADRSIYICQSHSLNLFLQKPTFDQLTSMHFYSWKKGLKTGIYYLRTKPISQAQMFTVDPEKLAGCLTCTA